MTAPRVSGYLLRRIPQVVAEPRWGGGLTRAELARALHVREHDQVFTLSLLVCYRRHQVDLWHEYVLAITGSTLPPHQAGAITGRKDDHDRECTGSPSQGTRPVASFTVAAAAPVLS
jgi:hypothetical protein